MREPWISRLSDGPRTIAAEYTTRLIESAFNVHTQDHNELSNSVYG